MVKTFNISVGHGKHVSGAVGFVKEYNECAKIAQRVFDILTKTYNGKGRFYNDLTSKNQNDNLNSIVAFHNKKPADLEISVHANSHESPSATGVEVLHLDMKTIAGKVSKAMANSLKLNDRGAKVRTNLRFLNNTTGKAILLECFFVTSLKDVNSYKQRFEALCSAIARAIAEHLKYVKAPSNIHIVASGENLTLIAKEYNTTVAKLRELNNIKNVNLITIGQKIQIR